MGCVALIILVVLAGIAIWVLDMLSSQRAPSSMPVPSPVSDNQTSNEVDEFFYLEVAKFSRESSFYVASSKSDGLLC